MTHAGAVSKWTGVESEDWDTVSRALLPVLVPSTDRSVLLRLQLLPQCTLTGHLSQTAWLFIQFGLGIT